MEKDFECASKLVGKNLNGKWKVIEKMKKEPGETGGNFSIGYLVEDASGKVAFLKAIDLQKAFLSSNVMLVLGEMTDAYKFEVDLLGKCNGSNLRYVVKLLDANQYSEPSFAFPVPYMVFECAETSARKYLDISRRIDFAWSLRSLHNVAVALDELHTLHIAHQDVKPSNVMLFEGKKKSKMGDVGRSSILGGKAAHDELEYAGDGLYSPLEQLYGWVDPDWETRRYSCDMYMLGNLIYTYFNGVSINHSIFNKLSRDYWPKAYRGTFSGTYMDILPLLVHVFDKTLNEFNNNISAELRNELITLVSQMCHPDCLKCRGDLKQNGAQRYSMERSISKLDWLCSKYEYELKKGLIE